METTREITEGEALKVLSKLDSIKNEIRLTWRHLDNLEDRLYTVVFWNLESEKWKFGVSALAIPKIKDRVDRALESAELAQDKVNLEVKILEEKEFIRDLEAAIDFLEQAIEYYSWIRKTVGDPTDLILREELSLCKYYLENSKYFVEELLRDFKGEK